MINAITYRVEFAQTGRVLEADLLLDSGLTSISGANEAGKSMVIEMIRYFLFGRSALRGPVADYRRIEGKLQFSVLGQSYTVVRNPRLESLSKGAVVVVVGASPVNEAVTKLLGFNLAVFDVACSCNQGEIERLTNMRPAERKRMVDSVVGMNQLDGVERWCREEALRLRREGEAILEAQRKPLLPLRPDDYEESAKVATGLAEAETMYRRYAALSGAVEPPAPVPPGVTESEAELSAYEDLRLRLVASHAQLTQRIDSIPLVEVTQAQVDAWRAHAAYVTECQRRGARPNVSVVEAEAEIAGWDALATYDRSAAQAVECPDCHSRFVPGAEHLGDRPAEPEQPRAFYVAELRANAAWAEPLLEVRASDMRFNSETEARQIEAAIDRQAERAEAVAALAEHQTLVSRAQDLLAVRRYDSQVLTYTPARAAYEAARAELAGLSLIPAVVTDMRRRYTEASVYEAQLASFLLAEQGYDQAVDRAEKRQADADALRRAGEALRLTRTKVKQHLIPALARTASQFLTGMTAGRRTLVEIDEEFDIRVDGQSVESLPGSAKALANLAVRLGLGQVLTQRVFPVFLGDELDAAMDAERVEAIADTLHGLTDRIQQVILVTHKTIDADHRIEL